MLADLGRSGLETVVAPLFVGGRRQMLAEAVADRTSRRCPTPVGTDVWLQILGNGGVEETDDALR